MVSADTLNAYVFRANQYDMFELDAKTGLTKLEAGEPIQLIEAPLTARRGILHLSPGQDAEEGPFIMNASPNADQLYLTPTNDGRVRALVRRVR